jgi:adenylylsulfate kinase
LNKGLGFSPDDRKENIRRIGEVSKLFLDAGIITIAAFVSPYESDRLMVRQMLSADEMIEVYVKCDLKTCELRDPKNLYEKARRGEIQGFTGVSAPYEAPQSPEIMIETDKMTVEESVDKILSYLKGKGILTL